MKNPNVLEIAPLPLGFGSDTFKTKRLLSKVPQITVFFWIIKVLATTVGETAADYLSVNLNFGFEMTGALTVALLALTLVFQFRATEYVPGLYWFAVVLISIAGTLLTDALVELFNVSLVVTTIIFSMALVATFILWYKSEKTLSIHSITTRKREAFYWLAILFTFALGTAAGDLTSESFKLGYPLAALVFAALIAAVAVAHYLFKLDSIWSFWLAYILTRPLGASIGDFLSQSENGGINLGTVATSWIFLGTILVIVIFLSVTKIDALKPGSAAAARLEE